VPVSTLLRISRSSASPLTHPRRRRYESDVTLLQKALNNEKFAPEILPYVA
jgi:hypothetical protein